MELKVNYELIATDETVDVAYGTVDGVWHFKFETDVGFGPEGGELWGKPLLGIIKMTMVPGYGRGVELVKTNK